MFRHKRILYLGSITLLLLSGLMFVANTKLVPTAHAASCNSVATGSWSNNCTVSEGNISNFVYAIQLTIDESKTPCGANTDGNFGPQTFTAVKCFQKAEGFPPDEQDGIVGPMTWGALFGTLTHDHDAGGWDYYHGQIYTTVDFRKFASSGIWYVHVISPSHWCQMNLNSPC